MVREYPAIPLVPGHRHVGPLSHWIDCRWWRIASKCRTLAPVNQTRGIIMAKNSKQTSSKAATAASKVLRDGRTSAASKTAAGSALSQKGKGKGK